MERIGLHKSIKEDTNVFVYFLILHVKLQQICKYGYWRHSERRHTCPPKSHVLKVTLPCLAFFLLYVHSQTSTPTVDRCVPFRVFPPMWMLPCLSAKA